MPVIIRWFPPSWLQLCTKDKVLYIDPAYLRSYFTRYPKKIEFSKWPDPIDGLPEDLAKADIILVTHDHSDHCKAVTVIRLVTEDTLVVAPRRCTKKLGNDIRVIEPQEELTSRGIEIKAVFAYNTKEGSSTKKVHHKGNGVGYRITIEGKTIYHAGDTDFIPEMKQLGPTDAALLPIGGTYTMDIRDAVKAALVIKPKIVIPMHHAKADPREFKKTLEAQSDIKVVPLQIGEEYQLN